MSEIRLVRCPKCDKVLPEPPVFTVYQCGGCGAMLKAKKRSSGSEKLVNSDKGVEGVKDSGGLGEVEGGIIEKCSFDMGGKSPARSTFGDEDGRKSSVEESDLAEFRGGLPKSPLRDRFLNDLSSSPVRSRNVSPSSIGRRGSGDVDFDGFGMSPARSRNISKSPVRERGSRSPMSVRTRHVSRSTMRGSSDVDYNGVGMSPARSRNVSKSPVRERGSRSPMSVRTRNVSRSPMRGRDDSVYRSPARTMNGDISFPPLRGGVVSELDECAEKEQEGTGVYSDGLEERVRLDKMTPKTSFNTWLPDDNHPRESNDNISGRRRTKWRDQIGDDSDRISEGKESVFADEHGVTSEGLIDDSVHGSGSSKGEIGRDSRYRDDYVGGNGRVVVESRRKPASSSAVDEPPSYHPDSIHGYGHSRHSFETQRGPANTRRGPANTHHEISQKYQGSRQQYPLNQRSEFDDTLFSSPGSYNNPDDYSEEEHLRFRWGLKQQFSPEKCMPRPSYFNPGHGLIQEMENTYNQPPLYDDPFAGHVKKDYRPKHTQHLHRTVHGYVAGKSLDFDQDFIKSYHNGTRSHSNVIDWQGHDLPSSLGHRVSPHLVDRPTSSHCMDIHNYVPRTYDPRMAHTSPRERPSHLAPHSRKVLVASQNKRICLPIAGGAPFVLCRKCFELLKLPGKFMTKHKKEYQLQCGSCSYVMSFDLQNRSFGVLPSQKKPDPVKTASGFGEELNDSGPRHRHDSFAATSTNLGSYDFDAIGDSFHSMGSEVNEPSRGRRSGSNFNEYTRGISPPSHSSKEERVSDSASVRSSRPNSSEMPLKIRPPPGSPLQEHLDYSTQFHIAAAANAINYTGTEKPVLEKDTSQDSSVVNTAVASETEVHSRELPTSLSDSGDAPRENKDATKHPSRSPFWSPFGPRTGLASPGKAEVYVNGQQVPPHVIKKAEKLAGPIESGNYWYDPKAGFWGVMGHHCLGIIPPSIQEFCFPMPASCSGGDTAVYVNGRELQKRDLDLLSSRGLPATRDKRYIIDISGKVVEEQSKDFIAYLGKLAPTVEKNKRGFGMRVPEEFKN